MNNNHKVRNHIINIIYIDFFVFKISIKVEIWQSCCCDDEDRNDEWWKSRQRKHAAQCKCNVTYKHNQKWQSLKKSQQDDSEFQELVLLKTHENWENQQDFCSLKKIEICHSHAYFRHVIQTNNNDENTRYSFQLCWNVKNKIKSHY